MDISTQENVAVTLPKAAPAEEQNGDGPAHQPQIAAIVIEPTHKWASLQLREIWDHRELLYFLVWRDLKVRYKQTALGVVWVLLQPLLMTLIFTVVLGRLVRVPSNSVPYSLFAYTGLTLWIFFSSACVVSSVSMHQSENEMSK